MRRATALLALCQRGAAAAAGEGLGPSTSHQKTATRGVKRKASELRVGNVLEMNDKLLQVLKFENVHMGRQLGNVTLILRDIVTRAKHPAKLRPSDSVEVAQLESRPFQFLYQEGDQLHCMDPGSFEQVAVAGELFGEAAVWVSEGLEVTLNFHQGSPVTGEVPQQVELSVREASLHMKGETAAPSYKPAILENGVKVMVPPFVQRGDRIVVDTAEGSFVRRA